jgi:hypothetical protein
MNAPMIECEISFHTCCHREGERLWTPNPGFDHIICLCGWLGQGMERCRDGHQRLPAWDKRCGLLAVWLLLRLTLRKPCGVEKANLLPIATACCAPAPARQNSGTM